jgi:RNA polymerase sigma-70 factor (ECF subfamily)
MSRSRTLTAPALWSTTKTTTQESVRTADERVTLHYREHAESVYRYLAAVYGSAEDARDVTQEAFLRLHRAFIGLEAIENPAAWVFTVARRLMLDRLKRARAEAGKYCAYSPDVAEAVYDPALTPEDALADRQRWAALYEALRGLSDIERQCLNYRAQGLKLREIGANVGLDLRRVAEIIDRAVLRLQGQVRD